MRSSQEPKPVTATLAQFKQLKWLAGNWRGSGGAYPSFFERYELLNDSTMRMYSFADSTLAVRTDSSIIEFRNRRIQTRGGAYHAVELSATSVRFMKPGAARGGHTFAKVSKDEWTATLHPAAPKGQPVVYVMKRVKK